MENQASNSVSHNYIEVAGELLSKPNSLGDLLEQHGYPSTLIFCNTPSDTDLLEVLLKKRGISASKLIGFVPPQKQDRAMERIRSKELCALVVTDIAARNLNLGEFELVINYSIQNDSELYLQRSGIHSMSGSSTRVGDTEAAPVKGQPAKVISLVSPLDLANFHFLRKALGFEFQQLQAATKEEIAIARAKNVTARAVRSPIASDENYLTLARTILKENNAEQTVAVLLHQMLEVLPQLQADIERAAAERENIAEDDGGQPGSFRRGGDRNFDRGSNDRGSYDRGGDSDRSAGGDRNDRRGGRSRDNNSRGRYDDRRDGRNNRRDSRNDSYGSDQDDNNRQPARFADEGSSEKRDYDERDTGNQDQGYNRNWDRGGDEDDGDSRGRGRRPQRDVVRIKEDRLYIGKGAKHGFTQNEFTNMLKDHCGVNSDQIKRFSLREMYSFVDLPEEVSTNVIEQLKGKSGGSGELFLTRALTLTTTIDNPNPETPSDSQSESDDEGHDEGESFETKPHTLLDEDIVEQ